MSCEWDAYSVYTQFLIDITLLNHFQIGFNAGMIIDDDMTMVSRGARVNPEYEVQGLYRMLDDKLALWAKSHHVTVKAQTTTEHNKVVSRPSFKKKNQRVFSRVCISYTMIFPFRRREIFKCHSGHSLSKNS